MNNLIKTEDQKKRPLPPSTRPILKQPVYNPLKKLGSIPDKCIRCECTVYPVERVQVGRDLYFHTKCFNCRVCDVKLNIKNFNSFKENDKVEVYCQRHLPKYPGDLAGEEYLGEVGIREAINLYRMGEPGCLTPGNRSVFDPDETMSMPDDGEYSLFSMPRNASSDTNSLLNERFLPESSRSSFISDDTRSVHLPDEENDDGNINFFGFKESPHSSHMCGPFHRHSTGNNNNDDLEDEPVTSLDDDWDDNESATNNPFTNFHEEEPLRRTGMSDDSNMMDDTTIPPPPQFSVEQPPSSPPFDLPPPPPLPDNIEDDLEIFPELPSHIPNISPYNPNTKPVLHSQNHKASFNQVPETAPPSELTLKLEKLALSMSQSKSKVESLRTESISTHSPERKSESDNKPKLPSLQQPDKLKPPSYTSEPLVNNQNSVRPSRGRGNRFKLNSDDITIIRPGGLSMKTRLFGQNVYPDLGRNDRTPDDSSEHSSEELLDRVSDEHKSNTHKALRLPLSSDSSGSDNDETKEFSYHSDISKEDSDSKEERKPGTPKILSISSIKQIEMFSREHQDNSVRQAIFFPPPPPSKPNKSAGAQRPSRKRAGSPKYRKNGDRSLPIIFERPEVGEVLNEKESDSDNSEKAAAKSNGTTSFISSSNDLLFKSSGEVNDSRSGNSQYNLTPRIFIDKVGVVLSDESTNCDTLPVHSINNTSNATQVQPPPPPISNHQSIHHQLESTLSVDTAGKYQNHNSLTENSAAKLNIPSITENKAFVNISPGSSSNSSPSYEETEIDFNVNKPSIQPAMKKSYSSDALDDKKGKNISVNFQKHSKPSLPPKPKPPPLKPKPLNTNSRSTGDLTQLSTNANRKPLPASTISTKEADNKFTNAKQTSKESKLNRDSDTSSTTSSNSSSSDSEEEPVRKPIPIKPKPSVPSSVLKKRQQEATPNLQAETSKPKPNESNPVTDSLSDTFKWKKQSLNPPISNQFLNVNSANNSLHKPNESKPSLPTPLNMPQQGDGNVMSEGTDTLLTKPQSNSNPKSILKQDRKSTSELEEHIDSKEEQSVDISKSAGDKSPQFVKKSTLKSPSTKPSSSQPQPISSDVTQSATVYKEMVEDVILGRKKEREMEEEENHKKLNEIKKKKATDFEKLKEWESLREKSRTQRSNEIADTLIHMDRAIDHVSDDLSKIDETLGRMNDSNRALMHNLDNLSDDAISDIETGSQGIQTEFSTALPKDKSIKTTSKPKPKPIQRTLSSSSSSSSESLSSSDSDKESTSKPSSSTTNRKPLKDLPDIRAQAGLSQKEQNLRHVQLGKHSDDESSICDEPERLAMREKVKRFEKKIDRNSGHYQSEKAPSEVPHRLNLNHLPGSEVTETPPIPMPRRRDSTEKLDTQASSHKDKDSDYNSIAAMLMMKRQQKGKDNIEIDQESTSSVPSNETRIARSGTLPEISLPNSSTLDEPFSSKSSNFRKGSVGQLKPRGSDDLSDNDSVISKDSDRNYVRGTAAYASRRRYQRGGSNFRASARAKSVEMLDDVVSKPKSSRTSSIGKEYSDSESDQELQDAYANIYGRQGGTLPVNNQFQMSNRSRSCNHLQDLDTFNDRPGSVHSLQPNVHPPSSSNFQRAYRGGVSNKLRGSMASTMKSMPDIRDKDTMELAHLLNSYLTTRRDDKVSAILRILLKEDRGRVDELLSKFNDELREILEEKIRDIGLTNEADADSVFNLAFSMSDLRNNLLPGVNTHEQMGANDNRYRSGFSDLGIGSGTIYRMLNMRPNSEESPPPPMKPPPKPGPQTLPKNSILTDWSHVDSMALEVSNIDICTFSELVFELARDCKSDVEKIRAIFRWITLIDYTHMDFDQGAQPDTLIGMMRGVKYGECSNNELFHKICRFAGIPCEFIAGYSKGAGYRPGMNLKDNRMFRNIWTAVFVGGCWRFVNCNWGARYLSTLTSSRNMNPMSGTIRSLGDVQYLNNSEVRCRCDEFYFLTDAEEHIFEHFPDNKRWQLLRRQISLEQFMKLPILKSPFFNNKMTLKKKYSETLQTKAGSITVKLQMPHFVGVSCTLENRADMSLIKGMSLVRIIDDLVVISASPAQPGKYYLNIYISEDWRDEESRELACSFQVHCSEHNYDRLVVGRCPEVGFLGRTPAAQSLGVAFNERTDPYIIWNERDVLKIPVTIAPGLKMCHQMKSFDRPGQRSAECHNYAILQTKGRKSFYAVRFPVEAFYYMTIYAAKDSGDLEEASSDQLECIYRFLLDVRKGQDRVLPYPRQTPRWNGCYLHEPTSQHLELNKRYSFRIEAPGCSAVSVVINGSSWIDLVPEKGSSMWYKKINVGDQLGELSVYSKPATSEEGDYVKLLDYALVQKMNK